MEIRALGPDDATALRPLRLRALREHPEAFTSSYEEDVQQPIEVTRARLAAQHVRFWGAFDGGALRGMVGLEREARAKNRHKGHVVAMYVAPEVAGHGVGRALLQAVIAHARGERLESLVLTVTEGNAGAQHLYEQCGFRTFGREPDAIRVGECAFAKNHMHRDLRQP